MACEHKRIKSVNCVLFCDVCGEKLPADFLTGKHSSEPAKAAETAKEPQETAKKKTTRKKA
jgi:hypothetical protein